MSRIKRCLTSRSVQDRFLDKIRFNKKAQITIFIIIGIIVLFIFAGVLFIIKSSTTDKFSAEGDPVIAKVSDDFDSIQLYTKSCLRQVAERGLLILGEQGGYIYPEEIIGDFSVANPTDSAGINLEPAKVPYWHYNSEPNLANNIKISSLKPKLYYEEDPSFSVEAQLSRFVNEKIGACLNDYKVFNSQGYQVEFLEDNKAKSISVDINPNTVNFLLNMKIRAEKGSAEQEMEQFYVKIPLKLQHYYEVAEHLLELEQNYSILERQALDLINVYGAVDVNSLPPTSAVTFDLIPTVYWNTLDVKEKLRELLLSNVPLIQFSGSANIQYYEYPVSDLSGLYQRTYDNMILPLNGEENLEIRYDYFNWEPYFDVNDGDDGTIAPQHIAQHFSMLHFGIQNYFTTYDLSYPVLVTITDNNAFDGDGYNFVFALESNIRNNVVVENDDIFPAKKRVLDSLVCDDDQFDTGILRTVVVDAYTQEPLESVNLGFSIPNQNNCVLGETNSRGVIETKYPAIYGGIESFIKEDYLTNFYPIDTYDLKENNEMIGYAITEPIEEKVVEMYKYKPINVTIKKVDVNKCVDNKCFPLGKFGFSGNRDVFSYEPEFLNSEHKWYLTNIKKPLKDTEQAIITLERVAGPNSDGSLLDNSYGEPFTTGITITGNEKQEVVLVPGIYKVTGNLILNEKVTIPEEERCTTGIVESIACFVVDGCCFNLDEVSMDTFMSGQINWDDQSSYLRIGVEDLYDAENIEFYLPSINVLGIPPENHNLILEDLQLMGEIGNQSKMPLMKSLLRPKFN